MMIMIGKQVRAGIVVAKLLFQTQDVRSRGDITADSLLQLLLPVSLVCGSNIKVPVGLVECIKPKRRGLP